MKAQRIYSPQSRLWRQYPSPCRSMGGPPDAGDPRTADGKPNLTAPRKLADGHPDLSGIWMSEP